MPIEGIIFDLDGTLIDYEGASHIALARPLEQFGKAFSWSLHASIVGTKPEDWSRKIVDATNLADIMSPEQYAEAYFEEVDDLYASITAWPGTADLLEKLGSAGFPMAIATSSPRASFEKKMAYHTNILGKMAAVVTGDEVTRGKPEPDIFLEAARRLGCDPSRCVVFEDSPAGIAGAHAAGCLAVALPDARMPTNAPRFTELAPRWLLRQGIGSFNIDWQCRVPPTHRARSPSAALEYPWAESLVCLQSPLFGATTIERLLLLCFLASTPTTICAVFLFGYNRSICALANSYAFAFGMLGIVAWPLLAPATRLPSRVGSAVFNWVVWPTCFTEIAFQIPHNLINLDRHRGSPIEWPFYAYGLSDKRWDTYNAAHSLASEVWLINLNDGLMGLLVAALLWLFRRSGGRRWKVPLLAAIIFRDATLFRETVEYLFLQHHEARYPFTTSDVIYRPHAILLLWLVNAMWLVMPCVTLVWACLVLRDTGSSK